MSEWSHSKKEVRQALDEAVAAGLTVTPTAAHGHSWGYIDCPHTGCGGRFYVWSTPGREGRHAKQIRRFIRRHEHNDEES
jgi:hypothetical protein